MNIVAVGINHKVAPIEVRERFYLSPTERDVLLAELKNDPMIVEALVLSTCNRVEIYAHVIGEGIDYTALINRIFDVKKIPYSQHLQRYFYAFEGETATRHLFHVSTGINSLILGENQILGQIKTAFERAKSKQLFSKHFNLLSNLAIRAGKKARTETQISAGGSSVSWASIILAEKLLNSLEDKTILVIGAGKMGELAIEQICARGVKKVYLMNRTGAKAENLSQRYNAIPASFLDIKQIMGEVDLCICSAGAPHYILDRATVEDVMEFRDHRRLHFIDISMPRNLDPKISMVHNVVLAHIDDLERVVSESMQVRQAAVGDVKQIIEDKIIQFYEKIQKLESQSTTLSNSS